MQVFFISIKAIIESAFANFKWINLKSCADERFPQTKHNKYNISQ